MAADDHVSETIKCLALPAAFIGTVQASAWFGMALVSILFYNNAIEMSSTIPASSYGYIIYNLYLNQSSAFDGNFIIDPKAFNIAMYFYLVLSFIWLLISLCIIWVFIRKKWNRSTSMLICWSTVTLLLAALDVTLMSILARDLHQAHQVFDASTTPASSTITTPTIPTTENQPVEVLDGVDFMTRNIFATSFPDVVLSDNLTPQTIYTSMGIVMSLAARGYILWIVNVSFAIILSISLLKFRKSARPSMMQMPIIDAYDKGPKPFSMYDQVEIDRSFQNEGFSSDEINIFSPRSAATASNGITNGNGRNPLSNGNRSSLTYGQTPSHPFETNHPLRISSLYQNGKLAKIGKSGGRRSPPQNIPSPNVPHLPNMPYIPEPDYTPPGSPESKPRSVLRPGSKYAY